MNILKVHPTNSRSGGFTPSEIGKRLWRFRTGGPLEGSVKLPITHFKSFSPAKSAHKDVARSPTGFTLVELIMAMAFFSFMMVILSVGVIQIMKIYQNNLATRRTQQSARQIVEDVTREIRGAVRVPVASSTEQRLCLEGAQTVEYQLAGTQLLKRVLQGSCANHSGESSQVLAGSGNLQIRQFSPVPITTTQGGGTSSVKFTITVTTGGDDLLEDALKCKAGTGHEYCSAATYISTVSIRGGEQ